MKNIILIALMLAGCASTPGPADMNALRVGMSMNEVVRMFGAAPEIAYGPNRETWRWPGRWCHSAPSVEFRDGKVVSWSVTRDPMIGCPGYQVGL